MFGVQSTRNAHSVMCSISLKYRIKAAAIFFLNGKVILYNINLVSDEMTFFILNS